MPYQDGTFPSGAPTITINSIAYKCNSFAFTDGSTVTAITDNAGDPSGHLAFKQATKGTAELQFAASTTAEPTTAAANSTTGVFTATINNVTSNCFIESVTVTKPANAPWTASVSWIKKVN